MIRPYPHPNRPETPDRQPLDLVVLLSEREMRQSGEMDWASGMAGVAAGASGLLSLQRLWARLRGPRVPLKGAVADEYVLKLIHAQGKTLEQLRKQLDDMNERLLSIEAR